jgi:arginyl-tRNA synthetase
LPTPTAISIEEHVTALVRSAVESFLAQSAGDAVPPDAVPEIVMEIPRNPDHGDWACSVALKLARPLRRKPLEIAREIAERIPADALIEPPTVAPPGFVNLRLATGAVDRLIRKVLAEGERYGHGDRFAGRRVMVEFVSANPTGPLHIGHGRGAVIGDALARVLAASGYEVCREYYYNDAGVQMQTLGESLRARYLQALGLDAAMPENGYQGGYMNEIGEQLKAERGDAMKDVAEWRPFTDYAADWIMRLIRDDLHALRIDFDNYFSETTLHDNGKVAEAIGRLKTGGRLYEQDGAWWLRSTEFGDEKDRVVIKSDGNYTYLAPDIAYHEYKFERGFDRLVNVLGADHHGYVPRLKAGIGALGHRPEQLDCVIVQMVGVENEGAAVKLSTRRGDFITLKDVIDAIGADVTRFLFLTRTADSQMVFDFKVAMDTSMDNPLYYVQYAHARCCSLMRKAEESGAAWAGVEAADLALLAAPEERAIAHQMDRLCAVVLDCAQKADPTGITAYLRELATAFHAYYTAGNKDVSLRVVQPDRPELTQARLALIAALCRTLANGLALVGVVPMERL